MNLLNRVEIKGYRGISIELNKLKEVNLLVGNNPCGKTSILEALSLMCQPQNPHEWIKMLQRRDFSALDYLPKSFKGCFSRLVQDDDIRASCHFKCHGDFPMRELDIYYNETSYCKPHDLDETAEVTKMNIQHSSLWNRSYPNFHTTEKQWHEMSLDTESDISYTPVYNKGYYIECETVSGCSYLNNKKLIQIYTKILLNKQKEEKLEVLLKQLDHDIISIRLDASFNKYGEHPVLLVKHRKLGVLPLSAFGHTLRRYVFLATALLCLNNGILLIDDFDINDLMLTWLIDIANEQNVQVFLTMKTLPLFINHDLFVHHFE